jgi:OOP family OmpA-OmpF porin
MADGRGTSSEAPSNEDDSRLAELRGLILRPEQVKIEELDRRMSSPETLAEQIGGVLAEAVSIRAAPDDKLAVVLRPIIESAIHNSVRSNPRFFADILYPVMGPAIRKAIAEALRTMVESFNTSLEMTFSWKYVKWRLEAIRTGRPFAEVVLLHTLVYRVEQLFLLHRESGLVLRHLSAAGVVTQDADLVSGMLTAIQDFVHDSFGGGEGALDSFRVGELGVWIEQSPNAVLAAVVRGNPPAELSALLRTQLEMVELRFGREMAAFRGDSGPLEKADELLEPCLIVARTGRKGGESGAAARKGGSPAAVASSRTEKLLLLVALLAIVAIAVFAVVALTSLG